MVKRPRPSLPHLPRAVGKPSPARPRTGSAVQRRLLLGSRERPRSLRATLLAEVEPKLTRWPQAVRVIRAERRARLVQIERAQQVAAEVALIARDLLRCCTALRHCPVRPPSRKTRTSPDEATQAGPNRRCNAPFRKCRGFSPAPSKRLQTVRIRPLRRARDPHLAAVCDRTARSRAGRLASGARRFADAQRASANDSVARSAIRPASAS